MIDEVTLHNYHVLIDVTAGLIITLELEPWAGLRL
jgi:hypothetical protein